MWQDAFNFVRQIFALTQNTAANTADIKQLRRDLSDLYDIVEDLQREVARAAENQQHEREKLALQLEVQLLKFERRLPPAKPDA